MSLVLSVLVALGCMPSAKAETIVFKKVVDLNTPRPDGGGTFLFNVFNVCPNVDNGRVIFDSHVPVNNYGEVSESIWSSTVTGRGYTKLVDRTNAVPGGSGTFFELNTFQSAMLRDGTVVFVGRDSNLTPAVGTNQGIYSVPVSGGQIKEVVSYNSPVPGGTGNFFGFEAGCCGRSGQISFDGSEVVFRGSYGGGPLGSSGIFRASADGSSRIALADQAHPARPLDVFPVSNFYNPAVQGGVAIFQGGNVFGYFGLYSTTTANPSATMVEFQTKSQPLPNATAPGDDTALDGYSLQLKDAAVAFTAMDLSSGLHGLYTTDLSGASPAKIFDTSSTLPGFNAVSPNGSFRGHAISGDQILFYAFDDSPGRFDSALFLSPVGGGAATRIVGTGDVLDGLTLRGVGPICPDSMNDGEMVFAAYFAFGSPVDQAIYSAAPLSRTADLTVAASAKSQAGLSANQNAVTVLVNNGGAFKARDVDLFLELPAGVSLVSSSLVTGTAGSKVKIALGDIASPGFATVDLVFQGNGSVQDVNVTVESNTLESNSANNTAVVQTVVTPTNNPNVSRAQTLLVTMLEQLPSASKVLPAKPSKNLPAKKKKATNAKRAAILNARSALKLLLNQLLSIVNSGAQVEVSEQLQLFTSTNMNQIKKDITKGSSAKTSQSAAKKAWKAVRKGIEAILAS